MNICDPKLCTGCQMCRQICPKGAISFAPNREGFLAPAVDDAKCIECGLCSKRCPANLTPPISVNDGSDQRVFAAWHKNKNIRLASTSGGVFSGFAKTRICLLDAAVQDVRETQQHRS